MIVQVPLLNGFDLRLVSVHFLLVISVHGHSGHESLPFFGGNRGACQTSGEVRGFILIYKVKVVRVDSRGVPHR